MTRVDPGANAEGVRQQDPAADFSTAELLSRAQLGDREAVERIFEHLLPLLYRHAHGRLPRGARGHLDTRDVVQDTVAAVLPKLPHFDPSRPGKFKAYLKKTIRNRVIDELRRVQVQGISEPIDLLQLPATGKTPDEIASWNLDCRRYLDAFARLRPSERELIVARFHLGLRYGEIALASGKKTEDAARVAVKRALQRLARLVRGGSEKRDD